MTRRIVGRLLVALACLVAWPATAGAQGAIVGTVRDTSGGVLPGVTVEASSPVLIEGTRTVFTDGAGLYRIENLRPGEYEVVFTLPGFQTLRRQGINLPSEFTATVNAEMRVGALEESITITADAAVVDVTTAVHTAVLNRETIDSVPTARSIQGLGQLIVGINLNLPDTGGARTMQQTYMSTHGMSTTNNTVLVDGMMVNGLQGDGAIQMYFNDAMNAEVSYQTAGIGAETSGGGVRLNMIPREGGNRFSGDFKGAYRPGDWQSENVGDRLIARGLTPGAGNAIDRIADVTAAQGGPILRDRLWFFTTARYLSADNFIADTFFDDGSQGVDDQFIKQALLRLTWQMSPRNKLSAYFDEVDKFRGHDMQSLFDPETASLVWNSPAYHTAQAKLTTTVTSRLLIEGGWSTNLEYYTNQYQPGIEQPRFSEAWFAGATRDEENLGGRIGAGGLQQSRRPERYNVQASASYVTGSHNIKAGFQYTWGDFFHNFDANSDLIQRYRSASTGVPFSVPDTVLIRNTPIATGERLNRDLGIFLQDSWRVRRLTVNGGIRWESAEAQVHAATSPAGRFIDERSFDAVRDVPNWTDWAPRFSAVYDVFGTGRTALKYAVNRYNAAVTTGIADDYNPLASVTRSLTWRDLNGDDIAQGDRGCVFLTPGCEIDFGSLPANFGSVSLNTFGDYPRTYNVEQSVEVQHEVMPRLSVTASWFHGDFYNLTTTINRNLTEADYTPFTVFNPLTGEAFTAFGLNADARGRAVDNLDTGDPARERIYNSFNFEFRARPAAGAQIFGGIAIEREENVNCTAPDDPNDRIFCDDRQNDIPFKRNLRLAGSYPLPWGVTVSAALQSNESPDSARTMIITAGSTYPATCPAPCPAGARIAPAGVLGQASLTVPIEPAAATRVERITQLDLKFAKTFRMQRVSISPELEIFNLNNSDAIISFRSTNSLNPSFLQANSIMQGRMIGIGTTVRW